MTKKSILLVIVFLLLAAYAVFWSMGKIKKQETQNKQVVQQQQQATEQNQQQTIQDQNQEVYYEIPELEIRFLVDQEMKDELIYSYQGKGAPIDGLEGKMSFVYLSTKNLAKIDKECSVDKGPIGAISMVEGKAENYHFYNIRETRQFENFFIHFEGAQSPCLMDSQKHQEFEQPALQKYSKFFNSEEFRQSIEPIKQKVYYDIPELGIRFLVDQEMKDELIYHYKGESTVTNSGGAPAGTAKTVGLATKTLLEIDKGCSAEESTRGSITRYEGNADNYGVLKKRPGQFRQFDNFSILYSGPQAVCFSEENTKNATYMQIFNDTGRKYGPFFRSEEFRQSIEPIN